MLHSGI